MSTIGRCIFLGADIDAIYDVLTDVTRITDWFEHIETISADGTFPEEAGTTANIYFRYGGVKLNYTMTVTEFVQGEYASFTLTGDLVGTQRWTTTPERGGYRLSIDYDYEVPVLGSPRLVERITRETLNKSLHNLKDMVEVKRTVPAYF